MVRIRGFGEDEIKALGREPGLVDMKALAKVLEDAWVQSMRERQAFPYWKGTFTKPVTKNHKISICTTCRDRLEDLMQTLPKNIKANSDYENLEFVVLDYNSREYDVGRWIQVGYPDLIESGRVVYLRTEEPQYFDMAHSRNVAFLAATGEIVNNVDADNLLPQSNGIGFATFINKLANEQPEMAIFGKSKQLLRGRIGFYKREFIELLGGYDETNLKYYGADDSNILNRAWELGMKFMGYRSLFSGSVKSMKHGEDPYPVPWWESEAANRLISAATLIIKQFKANRGRMWGKAQLIDIFGRESKTGIQG